MAMTTAICFIRKMLLLFYALLCFVRRDTIAVTIEPSVPEELIQHESYGKEAGHIKISSSQGLPNDTWDGHMHVVDTIRYPLAADAAYTPGVHSIWDAVTFENSVDMKNIIIVQPSIYGIDNSALLDALKALGPDRARGVVVFDEDSIRHSNLQEWHALGVRGVRLNLASTDASPDVDSFKKTVSTFANLVKPLGWMVQIYTSMDLLPDLESTILALKDMKFCFDHFAQPQAPGNNSSVPVDRYSITEFSSLATLLRNGNTWVKFSAPYRVDLDYEQLEAVAREILRLRNDRVIFATDWPHTRFEGLNIRPFEEKCLEWAREANAVQKMFSDNAKELWDVAR